MAAGENHFAPELNEKEVIELIENATLGSIKKATKYMPYMARKYFKVITWKLHFDN